MSRSRRLSTTSLLAGLAIAAIGHGVGLAAWDEFFWPHPNSILEVVDLLKPEPPKEPEEVEVAWVEVPDEQLPPDVKPPDKDEEAKLEDKKPDEKKPEEKKPEEKKDEPPKIVKKDEPPPPPPKVTPPPPPPKAPEVTLVNPPPPPKPVPPPPPPQITKKDMPKPIPVPVKPVPPPPPPPPIVAVKPPAPQPKPPEAHVKMVEVDDDKNVVKDPNEDAKFLSDKNRRVQQETRDTRTNLEKQAKGHTDASDKSNDTTSKDVGGKDEKVAQLEDSKASSLESKRKEMTAHNGTKLESHGVRSGDKGDDGQGGKNGTGGMGGQGGQGGTPGVMSMRGVEGRGAPGTGIPKEDLPKGVGTGDEVATTNDPGTGSPGKAGRPGREGAPGKPGRKGPKLRLDNDDYARIVGDDKAKEEVEVARRSQSHKKGRWEKKMDGIHSSLENFTSEVKPGNQTALGTRAAPFAVYIARMHRKIHEVWAFGFISDLNDKPASNPMNDPSLEVAMEIVLNADGTVDKVTIVKPSGVLTFDVAAVDTILSQGPYEETPSEIRSKDEKVYLHWSFHRDDRLCATAFADPFILDNPKGDSRQGVPGPEEEVARQHRNRPQKLTRKAGSETEGGVQVPHATEDPAEHVGDGDKAAAARANANLATPDDPRAEETAKSWVAAFETGDMAGLVGASDAPFKAGGQIVANDAAGVASVWRTILNETSSKKVKEWKLYSAAGYRSAFGRLPVGGEDGTPRLYLVVRISGEQFTLDVLQRVDGKYVIVGITR